MGTLQGTLDVMSLPDLLMWLASRARSGRLTITRGSVTKQVFIVEGAATQSSSDDPRERLGQHLINYGYVSESQLQIAFQTQVQTGVPLGRVLVLSEVLDEARLMRVLAFKTRECLLDAFDWEQGSFVFDPDVPRDPEMDAANPTNLGDVHGEGMSRRAMWGEIHKVLPGPQVRLEVKRDLPANLNPLDGRILECAAAGMTIGEVALEVRALDFHVFARVYDLAGRGVVQPRPVDTAVSPPWPQSLTSPGSVAPAAREELLAQLRAHLQGGDLEEVYLLAQRVLEREPNNQEALAALHRAEEVTGPGGSPSPLAVPQLAVPREHLEEYLLTSKERYLLSRIDGRRNLGQIIQLSPIQEMELLRIMRAFIQRGFVVMGGP